VVANRGASGIDGTVATAAGFASALRTPVTCVTGDLAGLHDLNSLAFLRETRVVLVVVNNDGGGIFHILPIAEFDDVFEPYFVTPHGMTFEGAARMFGLAYAQPEDMESFVSAYLEACDSDRSCVIEICTEREGNVALRERIMSALRQTGVE
jgi:2-succinyl-5-enolpyruvyl-6-hydroxy-3-cyclohexene-1-carboxylate synthase